MKETHTHLPTLIKWVGDCRCMWVYFNEGPIPVWWKVVTLSSSNHYLDGLWSACGPVATAVEVCYVPDECPPNLGDKLILHFYRPCPWPARPLRLAGKDSRKIPIKRRHEYRTRAAREARKRQRPSLFDDLST